MNHLSYKDVQRICEHIPLVRSILPEVSEIHHQNIVKRFYIELQKIKTSLEITPKVVETIALNCRNLYVRALSQAGTPIGMITAEAIMAPVTQTALDSFHHTGTEKGAATGIDASNETLNASQERKEPQIILHFTDKHLDYEKIYNYSPQIVGLYIKTLLKSNITYEYSGEDHSPGTEDWVERYTSIKKISSFPTPGAMFQRLVFKIEKLYENNITLNQVCNTIISLFDTTAAVVCIPSPTFLGIIDVYINTSYFESRSKLDLLVDEDPESRQRNIYHLVSTKIFTPKLHQAVVKGIEGNYYVKPEKYNTMNLVLFETELSTDPNYRFIHLNPAVQRNTGIPYIKLLRLFESCGIEIVWCRENISRIFYMQNQDLDENVLDEIRTCPWEYFFIVRSNSSAIQKVNQAIANLPPDSDIMKYVYYWYARVGGKNLLGTLLLPFVDSKQTYGTSYKLYEKTFGIDIIRSLLIREYVLLLKDINPAYIYNQANTQTCMGMYTSTTAQSATRKNAGTLPAASFQQASQSFIKAAPLGKEEDVKNTSSCIFLALPINLGTGHSGAHEDKKLQDRYAQEQQLVSNWDKPSANTTTLIPHNVRIAQVGNDNISDELYEDIGSGLPPPYKPARITSRTDMMSYVIMNLIGVNIEIQIRQASRIRQLNTNPNDFINLIINGRIF